MIKLIYTNGCSWTAGDGVQDDPYFAANPGVLKSVYDYAWPVYFARKLNTKLFNDAIGGGSNQRILRRLVEFTRTLPVEERAETLILVGWTSPDRDEIYLDERTRSNPDGWYRFNASQPFSSYLQMVDPAKVKAIDKYQVSFITDVYNQDAAVQMMFQQIYLAKNLLENLQIPFLFFGGMRAFGCYSCDDVIWKSLEGKGMLDLRNFSMDTFIQQNNLPLGPTIHPLIASNEAWADFLVQELQQRQII